MKNKNIERKKEIKKNLEKESELLMNKFSLQKIKNINANSVKIKDVQEYNQNNFEKDSLEESSKSAIFTSEDFKLYKQIKEKVNLSYSITSENIKSNKKMEQINNNKKDISLNNVERINNKKVNDINEKKMNNIGILNDKLENNVLNNTNLINNEKNYIQYQTSGNPYIDFLINENRNKNALFEKMLKQNEKMLKQNEKMLKQNEETLKIVKSIVQKKD